MSEQSSGNAIVTVLLPYPFSAINENVYTQKYVNNHSPARAKCMTVDEEEDTEHIYSVIVLQL